MATLALKPIFPIRTRSTHSKRDHRKQRERALQPGPGRTMSVATAAVALTFFCVLAPMIDDPSGRLFALDKTSTIPTQEITPHDALVAQAFELTPNMLGPAITAEMLIVAEEDWEIVTMPVLEVRAVPPMEATEVASPG